MESTRKKNILVTGGNGFIGWNFINKILKENLIPHNIVVNIDSMEYAAINSIPEDTPNYEFYKGKIGSLSESVLRHHNIDLVVNFAASTHVDNSIKSVKSFVENNVLEMSILMENCRNVWKERGTDGLFVQISTDEVFGSVEDQGGTPFNEYTLHHPNNPYSATKSAAEVLLRSFIHTYNFPGIITNCGNNYGPGQHHEKLIPKIIKCCLEKKTIPIYGDGLQKRDWIYVDDHCEGIVSAISHGRNGDSYLFGTLKNVTNLELTKTICRILDEKLNNRSPFESLIEFVDDRLGHDVTYTVDYLRSTQMLGWEPKTELTEGLEKTISWYLNKLS